MLPNYNETAACEFYMTFDKSLDDILKQVGMKSEMDFIYCPNEFALKTREKVDFVFHAIQLVLQENKKEIQVLAFDLDNFSRQLLVNITQDYFSHVNLQVATSAELCMNVDIIDRFKEIPDLSLIVIY